MIRIVITKSASSYEVRQQANQIVVEKVGPVTFSNGKIRTGQKFYGNAVGLQKGQSLVLTYKGRDILTTSIVLGIFNEKGEEVQ